MQRVVIVPKERVVSRFTGDGQQVKEFREQVRAALAAQATQEEEDQVRFLRSHLSTAVREELQCHPPQNRATTEGIFAVLEKVYGDRRTVCQLLTVFNSIYQRPGEGVREYANRLNKLCFPGADHEAEAGETGATRRQGSSRPFPR